MARGILGAVLIAALASTTGAVGMSVPAAAKDNTGAVVGGLIAGAVIGAAVAGSANHSSNIYVNPRPPPPPKPDPWANGFSPKPGVKCYPTQKACYNNNGAYNANWTWKVYQK
jgi:hypothetical protein